MHVREVLMALADFLQDIRERGHGVGHAHVLEYRPRGEPNGGLFRAHAGNYSVDNVQSEFGACLDGSAISVRAVVRPKGINRSEITYTCLRKYLTRPA